MTTDRQHLHTRAVQYDGYRRSDGLFDIEGVVHDFRHYATQVNEKGLLAAGDSVHRMAILATIDESLLVTAISSRMLDTPFKFCQDVEDSLQPLVGVRMGTGWRRAINERIGGTRSCTHLRELLLNMATAALQTVPTWQSQQRRRLGLTEPDQAPHYLGQCHSWRADGPVVKQYLPLHFQAPLHPQPTPPKE